MQTTTTGPHLNEGFSLTRKIFNDFRFIETLRELAAQPLYLKVSWNINRIVKQAQTHIDKGQEEVKVILDKYAEKDEKGTFKRDEKTNDFIFADRPAFEKEYDAFLSQELHFKSNKLSIEDLSDVKLAADKIDFLEAIIIH